MEKDNTLKALLLSLISDANFFNTTNPSYPHEMASCISTFDENISCVIKELHSLKASGSVSILFFVLKNWESSLISFLKFLFLACINFIYYPTAFWYDNTVVKD
jgi:hypothetical protein